MPVADPGLVAARPTPAGMLRDVAQTLLSNVIDGTVNVSRDDVGDMVAAELCRYARAAPETRNGIAPGQKSSQCHPE
jgi:hypothetical protein